MGGGLAVTLIGLNGYPEASVDLGAVAMGRVPGMSMVNKFGRNPDIDIGTVPEDIWNGSGVYAGFPTGGAERIEVLSSSVNDASAGTGARTVRLTGLDVDYNVINETVTLNGTAGVLTAQSFIRMHTATVLTSGSSNQAFNAGALTFRHQTTTSNIFAVMPVGRNQTNAAAYTVPAGFTAYMVHMAVAIRAATVGVATPGVDGSIWTRSFGASPRLRRPFTATLNSRMVDEISGGLAFAEKDDIAIRITASSNDNLDVTANYDLLLVRNT